MIGKLQKHKKIIIIFPAIALVVGSLFVIKQMQDKPYDSRKDETSSSPQTESSSRESSRDCKSDPNPVFTYPFTDLSNIASIGPLGSIVGGSPARSYLTVKNGEVPVYMPTDAKLERLVYARRGGPSTPGEYGLEFKYSCEVTFMFDHVDRVTDEIKALAPKEPDLVSSGGTRPNKVIKAGTLLGYSDGTPLAKTWDFFLTNTARKPSYINSKRWTWDQAANGSCPYDYYTTDLKTQYYSLLGMGGGQYPFTKAKDCGSPSKDVSGTVSGGWFKGKDSTDSKGFNLNIGSHIGIPQFNIRENGNKTINFTDWDTKILPETVKVRESVCYYDRQGTNKWAYLKLISEGQLLAATGDGRCPSAFPTDKAEVWER